MTSKLPLPWLLLAAAVMLTLCGCSSEPEVFIPEKPVELADEPPTTPEVVRVPEPSSP